MFHKTKNKNKKHFCKSCLQCFNSENVLTEHKKDCLSINGVQSVKSGKGTIEFKNYFKQIAAPFKIYADFERNLKSVEINEGYSKNVKNTFLAIFLTKLFLLTKDLARQLLFSEVKMLLLNLLKQFIRSMSTEKM